MLIPAWLVAWPAGEANGQIPSELPNPCNYLEENCDDSPTPHGPLYYLNPLANALTLMQDDLLSSWFQPGLCATVEHSEPVVIREGDVLSAGGFLYVLDPGDEIIPPHFDTATVEMTTNVNAPWVDVEVYLEDRTGPDGGISRRWTLTMRLAASQGSVYLGGTIERHPSLIDPEGVVYDGGWIYDPSVGPMENPTSDAGFHTEVAAMFGCDATVAAGGILGSLISGIAGGLANAIYYWRDLFRPYTAPTSCSGPIVSDGSGQSCEDVDMPCKSDLAALALKIDKIPGVSTAFKKCMKGRFGCGGSSFPRLRITCNSSSSCGPCGAVYACNMFGSTFWYCYGDTELRDNRCNCVEGIFHEAAHSCGIGHSLQYWIQGADCGPDSDIDAACRVGDWFSDEYRSDLDGGCVVSSEQSMTWEEVISHSNGEME